jgi:hypothetical protein
MDEEALRNRLFEIASARALSAGRRLGEGADADLRALTGTGAAALIQIADEKEPEARIREAEADIGRLIDLALDNANNLADYPADLLGERTYFPAKFRFCPCRPFC